MRKFKLFMNPVEGQAHWLNEQAKNGWKLSKVGRLFYEFEPSNPGEYQYAVDYIGNKSNQERIKYEEFISEMNITYYEKPINLGHFSIGKVKYRPFADKGGKIATSRGMINRELLILEKKNDGKPFAIYSNITDKIEALKERRKPYIYFIVFTLLMGLYIYYTRKPFFSSTLWNYHNDDFKGILAFGVILGLPSVKSGIRVLQLSLAIRGLREKMKVHEV
ncbi:MAG: DUF2812 domain-containing protein [Tepidanaerobacter acetatoxydans]|uniref:DUF2812 domain-containing protein n=1 Tax=Tepidanaerobacter acetatoxydans (strain DSM 21804 / JCM 16047 / Re1) TaxID=1209989 RepID=F4LWP6_TEPAE|nr:MULTISPECIES: DUF2812 domain-containing protein [Tepidanaerobacter]AEE90948.1 hypothetical protein TepRe1_0763 [Tepidanaerobacter acetatoxydans Re1]NLU10149.1 DUF2812 domain-containing protein [Tepidanaerobacter acetatoxydans]CCP25535.1 conserved protein of unknown function [Tepidanaerobacter acetatoxydans Re1]